MSYKYFLIAPSLLILSNYSMGMEILPSQQPTVKSQQGEASQRSPLEEIRDLSDLKKIVQPGDLIMTGINSTLMRPRDGQVWNLDPKMGSLVAEWQSNPDKGITFVIVTTRPEKDLDKIKEQFKIINLPENTSVIHAPNTKDEAGKTVSHKAEALAKFVKELSAPPKRIIVIEDLPKHIPAMRSELNQAGFENVPLILMQKKTDYKLYENNKGDSPLPDKLVDLNYKGYNPEIKMHLLEQNGQNFGFECILNPQEMMTKIAKIAMARSLGAPSSDFAVYDHHPKGHEGAELTDIVSRSRSKDPSVICKGPGPYLLHKINGEGEMANPSKWFLVTAFLNDINVKNDDWDPLKLDVPNNLSKEDLRAQAKNIIDHENNLLHALDSVDENIHLLDAQIIRDVLHHRLSVLKEKFK